MPAMSDGLDRLLHGWQGLDISTGGSHHGDDTVRADTGREHRKGVPEVILADRKRPADTLAAVQVFLDTRGRAILSRTPETLIDELREQHADCQIVVRGRSGIVILKRPTFEPPPPGGTVGVLTAGTSDISYAEEAEVVAAEMGCTVRAYYDVGVAGIHRLAAPLRDLRELGADVIIVAAGMDGALPSVVSGLVDVPVIGLPTPIGYGLGGEGVAALMTMLQTCAPGLTVVNIGNGVGAGASAAMIANRVAAARSQSATSRTGSSEAKA